MAETPTYYDLQQKMSVIGAQQPDIIKAIYNLYKAVYAICYNIDEDTGTTGTDYLTNIGTDLATAMANLKTPTGDTT